MTHPKYTAKYLLNKGISYCKQIAKELGINPEGDKRQLFTWVDAIVEHQSSIKPVEVEKPEATIAYDNSIDGTVEGEYMVIAGDVMVRRFRSYLQAEKWASASYSLVSPQEVAQAELEAVLEVQAEEKQDCPERERERKSQFVQVLEQHEDEGFTKFIVQSGENIYTVTPAHPLSKERCECGDVHFRGVECKHQIAVKNEIASQIQFTSPTDFGFWEAVINSEVVATIDQDFESGKWVVNGSKFNSYAGAEKFIKDEYIKGVFMHRGSGRINKPIEDIAMTIEESMFVHDFGQAYALRVHGVIAGSLFLDDDKGWTINGEDFSDGWRPVAKELAKVTRHHYLLAA